MKQLTEEQLLGNWNKLLQLVEDTFEGERKERLLEMYKYFEDRMVVKISLVVRKNIIIVIFKKLCESCSSCG